MPCPPSPAKKMSPDKITSADAEYEALSNGRGFVSLVDWASVTLTGADRQKFLNNFCTNDVGRLTPGESCETFFCNVKGRILGHGLVTCREDSIMVIGPGRQGSLLASHLDRYVIREDVQARDGTSDRAYLLATGEELASLELPAITRFAWKLIDREAVYLLESVSSKLISVSNTLTANGFTPCGPGVFNTLRIEAGTPLFGIDFDDRNFPQEIGRNAEAISFTKGCYLGQETVARIDALGHVNQQIVGVGFSGSDIPPIGTELTHGETNVGRVSSATFSPVLNRPLALAMVRREHNTVGSKLESATGACEVIGLPISPRLAAN
jgi:tRNA-modifying protein YgfZ